MSDRAGREFTVRPARPGVRDALAACQPEHLRLEPLFSVLVCLEYAWYIPRMICSPPSYDAWYIHGISLDIPCIMISIRLDIHGISLDIL
jgi:hypothetical protein